MKGAGEVVGEGRRRVKKERKRIYEHSQLKRVRTVSSAVASRAPAIAVNQEEQAASRYDVGAGVHVLQDTATRSRSPGRRTRRFG